MPPTGNQGPNRGDAHPPQKRLFKGLGTELANFGWVGGAQILQLLATMVVGALVARWLGPDQYGKLSFALSIVLVAEIVSRLGLTGILKKELIQNPDAKHRILGTAYGMKAAAAALLYGGYLFMAWRKGFQPMDMLILFVGGLLFLECAKVVDGWFHANLKAKYSVLVITGALLAIGAARVFMVVEKRPLAEFALSYTVYAVGAHLLLLMMYQSREHDLLRWRFDPGLAWRMLRQSWPVLLNGFNAILYSRVDQLMLARLDSFEEVGTYSAAVKIIDMTSFFPIAIGSSFLPSIIRGGGRSVDDQRKNVKVYFAMNTAVGYMLTLGFALSAPLVIPLLYGEDFRQSILLLRILSFGLVFRFLIAARGQVFLSEDLLKLSLLSSLAGLGGNILLNLYAIPAHGAVGAAYATLASLFITLWGVFFHKSPYRWVGASMLEAMLHPWRLIARSLKKTSTP